MCAPILSYSVLLSLFAHLFFSVLLVCPVCPVCPVCVCLPQVSSCNYPARARGVKAGMFMKQAKQLCPELVVLRYDFEQYETVSKQLYRVCLAFSPAACVQPVSVDELYIQLPARCDVLAATQFLRAEILRLTGCSASAGAAGAMCTIQIHTYIHTHTHKGRHSYSFTYIG